MLRAQKKKDISDSDVYVSVDDDNRSDDNNQVAEKQQSSSSPSSGPTLLEGEQDQSPKVGQEPAAAAQGPGLESLTTQGVPQMEGKEQGICIKHLFTSLLS